MAVDARLAGLHDEQVREHVREVARDREQAVVHARVDRDRRGAERREQAVQVAQAAGSVSASGVRYQVAPSNSSARAFCAPRVSMPQIGWPPMKRARSAAGTAATTPALVEPMSVIVAPGASSASSASTAGSSETGAQSATTSAPATRRGEIAGRLVDAAPLDRGRARARVRIPADDARHAGAFARSEPERPAHQAEPDDREPLDHAGRASPRSSSARWKARSSDWRAFRRGSQSVM